MPKNVIVIAGPTASGKSRLAIDLAKELDGIIVNADASQVYGGIPIIAASPSIEDKKEAEHRLYEYLDVSANGNVYDWLDKAVSEIRSIWRDGKLPIVVGGGGLYLDNLINGTTPIPNVKPEIREEIMSFLEQNGVESLYERLKQEDAEAAKMLRPNDTTRVRRALEIFYSTGISISEWYKKPMVQKIPEAEFLTIVLLPDKKFLDERCDTRFEKMLNLGAVDEVKYLISRNLSSDLPAMRAKGVPELIEAIQGKITFDEAVDLAKIHTRQYAKRQLTWFRNKLKADIVFKDCYIGQKDFINDVKKQYK